MAQNQNSAAQNVQLAAFARRTVEFRRREFLTDVTVVCDGKPFPAHALVLSAGSTFFEQAFATVQDNFQGRTLELQSLSAEAFEIVLDFFYTGKLPPAIENGMRKLTDLLGASQELKIDTLYQYCLERLQNMMNRQHFLSLWNLSVQYQEQEMQRNIMEFVSSNFPQTSTCVDFLKLSHEQLLQILTHPHLDVSSLDKIISSTMEWIKCDPTSRREHLHALMSNFDVNQMSTNYLKDLLNSEPLIRENAEVYDMLVTTASTRLLTAQATTVSQASSVAGSKLMCFGRGISSFQVRVFNQRNLTWSSDLALPFVMSQGMVVAVYKETVCFIGGGLSPVESTNSMFEYSATNWRLLQHSTLSSEVWKAGAVVLHNKLYIIGGMNKHSAVTNTVQCYDFADRTCNVVASTNNTYCVPIVVATLRELFVIGSSIRATVEMFDPLSGQWSAVFPNHLVGMSPRAAACMQKLYVISDSTERKFRVYDPQEGEWEEEVFNGGPAEIRGMWSVDHADGSLPFIFVRDGRKALFSYTPGTREWQLLSDPLNIPWNWWQTTVIPELAPTI